MSDLYSIDVRIYGTLYIKADSAEEALQIAKETDYDDAEIDGSSFHRDMADVSLSPAFTMIGPDEGQTPEFVQSFEDDDEEDDECD